jgi:hypothetical protein
MEHVLQMKEIALAYVTTKQYACILTVAEVIAMSSALCSSRGGLIL